MSAVPRADIAAEPTAEERIAAWASRPVSVASPPRASALTIDVEDYFQVEAFFRHVDRSSWDSRECRVERNTDLLLEIFDEAGVKGTFFTLGWVAERYPALVRRIVAGGHELASHGLSHFRADSQDPDEFRRDVSRAKAILEDVGGVPVNGYRAASFSIGARNLWAFDVLAETGHRYSSSVFPIRHDRYGIPEAPRFAFRPLDGQRFLELPVTTVRRFGATLPGSGGGYFRLLPYFLSAGNLSKVLAEDHQPCIFYLHPWEVDPEQPRIPGISRATQFRHYVGLDRTVSRLKRLVRDFAWDRIDRIFPVLGDEAAE
ncbi:MAG TPA: XrtA system polysaccharide deacetylase [Aliidongia sp.]|nr:XrtA system polysaccharide deacetylase [Aliidongia sp.]